MALTGAQKKEKKEFLSKKVVKNKLNTPDVIFDFLFDNWDEINDHDKVTQFLTDETEAENIDKDDLSVDHLEGRGWTLQPPA